MGQIHGSYPLAVPVSQVQRNGLEVGRWQAEGYRAERVARAEGDADRFNQLVAQYKAAPEVTRKRLYLETMQQVLKDSVKVVDSSEGRSLLNLPLDRLVPASTTLAPGAGVLLQADDATRNRGGQ